jgi:predicted DNA-binding transcriptional regulator AlpA
MKLLRTRQVMQATGLSRMTIYRLELAGKFPSHRRLAENSVAWLSTRGQSPSCVARRT